MTASRSMMLVVTPSDKDNDGASNAAIVASRTPKPAGTKITSRLTMLEKVNAIRLSAYVVVAEWSSARMNIRVATANASHPVAANNHAAQLQEIARNRCRLSFGLATKKRAITKLNQPIMAMLTTAISVTNKWPGIGSQMGKVSRLA